MASIIIGYKLNCAPTKTTQLPWDVSLKFLTYLKASQVFSLNYNESKSRCTHVIFLTYNIVTAASTNIYWVWNVCLNNIRERQCLRGGLYRPRANCILMHKYEHTCMHTPRAAEIYELGMCSVLPADFVPLLKSDVFVCPVLYYAYKIRISKTEFQLHKMYLHDWVWLAFCSLAAELWTETSNSQWEE